MSNNANANASWSSKVTAELETNYFRVQAPLSANRLWERILTDQERNLLGGDIVTAYAQGGTIGMWMRLRNVSQLRAIIDLAFELNLIDDHTRKWLLRETGELCESIEEAIEVAAQAGNLVLVERDRDVYWGGNRIDIDWHKHAALWNFIWTVCEHARSGNGVDHTHFGERRDRNYPSKTKNKLLSLEGFPADLGNLIIAGGRGIQRLELPPERIKLFSITTVEMLQEVLG